jgi:hypothetical protein
MIRVLFGMFLLAHGVGHVSWFLAAVVPSFGEGQQRNPPLFNDGIAATGGIGKVIGVAALLVVAAFVVGGIGFFLDASWWRSGVGAGLVGSMLVAVAWWNPAGVVSALAVAANAGIALVVYFPLGDDLITSIP